MMDSPSDLDLSATASEQCLQVKGGQAVQAVASATAQTVATAIAQAVASASATTNVQGAWTPAAGADHER